MANDYMELMITPEYKDLLNTINHILLFYQDENYEDVIKFLNTIIEKEPYLTWSYKFLYKVYDMLNDEEKAKEIMNELSEINADYKYFNIEKKHHKRWKKRKPKLKR